MRAKVIAPLAALIAAIAAPNAVAADGTYVVSACEAGGAAASTAAWSVETTWYTATPSAPETVMHDSCSSGGVIDLGFDEAAPGLTEAFWTFSAPAGTSIAGARIWRWVKTTADPGVEYQTIVDGGEQPLESADIFADHEFGSSSYSSALEAHGLSAGRISMQLICQGGFFNCTASDAAIRVKRAEITLRDAHEPSFEGSLKGRLVEGAPLDGVADLGFGFADVGGGVESAALRVDGSLQPATRLCERPFVARTPCPTRGDVSLNLDTGQLAAGPHSVEAVITDAAGNAKVLGPVPVLVRPAIVIETSTPMQAGPVPPPAAPLGHLSLSSARRTLRASYDTPPVIKGTVKAADGSALAGVTVTTSDGTRAKTDAKGRFSVKLGKGVSREVRISYGDSVQTVKVIVAAPVRLKTDKKSTRNGRSITFTGSVPGAGNARTRVELQALASGKWIPFKTAELRNGKFKASYRFLRTFATQRYSFRAVIRADEDFPYAAGKSAVVRVVVRA